jgi:hypothetical protein
MYVHAILWVVGLIFCLWTVRKLRPTRKPGSDAVYTLGVKGFGLWLWAGTTPLMILVAYVNHPEHSLLYYAISFGVWMLPVCLWGGYLWGFVMNAMFPTRRR